MDKKRFLSLISFLAILVVIPIATAALQSGSFNLRISALEDDEPRNIVISDVSENSFRVNWLTEREVIGGVFLSSGLTFSEDEKTSFHSIKVNALESFTQYSFKILSGTKEFVKDNGKDYTVKTADLDSGTKNFLVYGQVFSPDGYTFQQGGLVTLELTNPLMKSQVSATTINKSGGFQFDLGKLLTKELDKAFPYQARSDAKIVVYTSTGLEGFIKNYTVDFSSNNQLPNIYLGDVNIDLLPAIDGT